MNKKWLVGFSALILMALAAGVLTIGQSFFSNSQNLLRLALENHFESLDPGKAFSDDALLVSAQVNEPLYQYHYLKRPYELEPLVAESMPVLDATRTVLTIRLKDKVQYHDHPAFKGQVRLLKAQDFVNQFKRLALDELKSPARSLFAGVIKGFANYGETCGQDWRKIPEIDLSGFKALDDKTLQITLERPEPNIFYYLALNFVVPIPWEIIEFEKNNLDRTLIGTGPYYYQGYHPDYYGMKRFKAYRRDYYPTSGDRYANMEKLLISSRQLIPFVDEVKFFITTRESDRWEMFLKHQIDILSVPKSFIPKLFDSNGELHSDLKQQDIKLKHFPSLSNRWLAFNMRHPLFKRYPVLREAIAYGIDYEKYIKIISQNTNLRANSILAPGISGYTPAKEFRFNYQPEKAKKLIESAGLGDPSKAPEIIYSTRGNQNINILEAEFIKEQLESLGLKVKVEVLDFPQFLKRGRAGDLMFFTDNWLFDYPDGENIFQLLVSSNFPGINKSGYSNPALDKLYIKLKQTNDGDQRDMLILQMEDLVFKDIPWIPLMYESTFVLQYPEIKNFRKSSIIRNYIKYLKIER
jgi:oligopeptide transport system substrate-binding protein